MSGRPMKETGIPWLGAIPAEWGVRKLGHVLLKMEAGWSPQCIGRPAQGEEWGVLKAGCVNTGTLDPVENKALPSGLHPIESLEVRRGDLLMNRASGSSEHVGAVGIVSTDVRRLLLCDKLYRLHPIESKVSRAWILAVLRSHVGRRQIAEAAMGQSTLKNISQEDVRRIQIPVPTLDELQKVTEFLDARTASIDAAIQTHERNLVALAERRRTLVSHAVTRGLDTGAPMRDSGVAWIGEIPAGWEMVDLRRLVEPGRPITYGIVLPGENVSDGVPIIKSGDCTPERLSPATLHRTTHAIASRYERSRLRGGDLVFSIRGTVGLVAVLPSSLDGANLTQDAARIAPTPETHRGWLLHVLRSTPIQIEVAHRTVGATVRGLNLRELRRLSLPRPPFAEQQRIAAFLDERTALIDAAAEKTRRAIELLREYRQSLITAAVTGRVSSEAISQ
jgi:type I restriction enzyme S subunit